MKNSFYAIIDGSSYGAELYPLSKQRSTSSIPFFGRYRLIDFIISSLTNSSCKNITVYTGSGASLHDHLGDGAAWNLNTNRDGLFILDIPFVHRDNVVPYRVIEQNQKHFEQSKQEFVVLCHGLGVHKIDFQPLLAQHATSKADISYITHKGNNINFYILRKAMLAQLIKSSDEHFEVNISDTVANRKGLNIASIDLNDLYAEVRSIKEYFDVSLRLLNMFTQDDQYRWLLDDRIRTKNNHSIPTLFTGDSKLTNATVANGCNIHGEVSNAIVFRNVTIQKGSEVNRSIIMANTEIGANCKIEYAIIDRNVKISDNTVLIGTAELPKYVAKGEHL